jgi:hypothetical protein
MSQPSWEQIGIYRAGIIPILYQRYGVVVARRRRV